MATVHEAFKHGINFIDTSAFYGNGLSEIVSESHKHGHRFSAGNASWCAAQPASCMNQCATGMTALTAPGWVLLELCL